MTSIAVQTQALSKSYRIGGRLWRRGIEKTTRALIDVDLKIAAGEVFGIVGRNGYGKTTLVKCIASLLLPSSGSVRVFGLDTKSQHRELRRAIGWIGTEERSFYFRLTGQQNLRFFAKLQGIEPALAEKRMNELAERFGIVELLTRRFHEYSTGNRQKLALVRGLLHEPRLLMLDEPTRSLDPFAADTLRVTLMDWVREDSSRTVIITSHNLHEIESLSDRVGVMSRGRLRACGAVDKLRQEWGTGETIGIHLEERPAAWENLAGMVSGLQWEKDHTLGGWLRFNHKPGDGTLDRVIGELHAARLSLLSVDRKELSLQDIVDRVDQEKDQEDAAALRSGRSVMSHPEVASP